MKSFVGLLFLIFSNHVYAIDCGLHRFKNALTEDIQLSGVYQVLSLKEAHFDKIKINKIIGSESALTKLSSLKNELGGCHGKDDIVLKSENNTHSATCLYGSHISDTFVSYNIDQCNFFTSNKTLATFLNGLGRYQP